MSSFRLGLGTFDRTKKKYTLAIRVLARTVQGKRVKISIKLINHFMGVGEQRHRSGHVELTRTESDRHQAEASCTPASVACLRREPSETSNANGLSTEISVDMEGSLDFPVTSVK